MSSSLGQVRGALGQLNSQINTTAATLPKVTQAQQQMALRWLSTLQMESYMIASRNH